MDELQSNLQEILDEKIEKIVPENIKSGVTIFGVDGAIGGSEVYSTEEQVIGKWIDGKPLYRKVITFPMPVTSDWGVVTSHIFNISNDIDYAFVEHYHMVDSVNEKYILPVSGVKNNVYYFVKAVMKDNGTGYLQNSNPNWGTNCTAVISVLYTKTTD